jgi:tetratricopeptide (TPR) repeat protein
VLDLRMTYFQSDDLETEFYTNSNLAISKGEARLEKNPDDFWTQFFVAGAKGVKGTYESRYGRWISAFRNGWQGVTAIKDLVKKYPDVKDLYFGLGTYDYWRSALTKQLWWMPGVADRRQESIGMLQAAVDSGVFVRQAAAYHLISILLNEKKYAEALKLSDAMMAKYPRSLLFSWGKGQALLGLQRFDEASKLFQGLSQRVGAEGFKNNYSIVLCHYYLSKSYFGLKQDEQCKREINAMFSYPLSEDTRKRLGDYFNDAMALKKTDK